MKTYKCIASTAVSDEWEMRMRMPSLLAHSIANAPALGLNQTATEQVVGQSIDATSFNRLPTVEVVDYVDSTATTGSIDVGSTVQGTISNPSDQDWYQVRLEAGHTYHFAIIGTGLHSLTDTSLRILDSTGLNSLITDTDSGPGKHATIYSFTPNSSGFFFIDASGQNGRVGQYGLSVTDSQSGTNNKAFYDVFMAAGSLQANEYYETGRPLDWNEVYGLQRGQAIHLTYSFCDAPSYINEDTGTFSKCSLAQIEAVTKILTLYSDICGLSFTRVEPNGYSHNADLVISNYTDYESKAGAYAYFPTYSAWGGDLWLNTASVSTDFINPGDYSWFAIAHEIGHAIGLTHPGDYNAGTGTLNYNNSAQFFQDTQQYSIMSYWSGSITQQSPGQFATAYMPLLADILALQQIYGSNTSTRSTDTTYGFQCSAGSLFEFSMWSTPNVCIWDGGGIDTLNAQDYTQNQKLNLNEGEFSNIGGGVSNISIAIGAVIENATGGYGDDFLTGNLANNMLIGGSGNDVLDGGSGADHLKGGAGNDTYVIDNVGDLITENLNEGTDLAKVAISTVGTYTLSANLENALLANNIAYNLTGNSLNNALTGNAANNILDGGGGADTLTGGDGNDTYIIDSLGDCIVEETNGGTTDKVGVDIRIAGDTYTLANNVERAYLIYTGVFQLTGNGLDNTLIGNTSNNTLDGGLGADILKGGAGNDTYVIDNVGDLITENLNEGTDLAKVAISTVGTYTLSANLENALLANNIAYNLTGNSLNNALTGNAANNILDGGGGADTLTGGDGNDTYIVDNPNDIAIEQNNIGAGSSDFVSIIDSTSGRTYILGANIELCRINNGVSYNVTGNDQNNTITGNGADNTLNGGKGADNLIGGGGDDTYKIDSYGDNISENIRAGIDTVLININTIGGTYYLPMNVENALIMNNLAFNLLGNNQNNKLTGNSSRNTLDGGAGNDILIGGAGNDTYVIDTLNDQVIEEVNNGIDKVRINTSIVNGTYILTENVEEAQIINSIDCNLTGNDMDNTLTGNSANNTLNGGTGSDIMIGGKGDDVYIIDNKGDNVIESQNAGTDTVYINISVEDSYTLTQSVENGVLAIGAKAYLTGNTLANSLIGNDNDNHLDGGNGDDMLIGGFGADSLKGGLGHDTFRYHSTHDSLMAQPDVIIDFTADDKIDLSQITRNLNAFQFTGSFIHSNAAWYEKLSDITKFYADFDGDAQPDFAIIFRGTTEITSTDLILI